MLSEPLGALLLTGATLAVVLAWQRPRWWAFALAGFLYALAIFTRADFVLMPIVVVALLAIAALHRREPRLILRTAGIFAVACGLTLAPWVLYASARQGHPVLVTEGDASALYVGTYLPGGGTTYGMKRAQGDQVRARFPEVRNVRNWDLEARWVFKLVAARHPGMSQDDAVRLEARQNLRRYALGDPIDFAGMMLQKVRRTWILSSRVGGDRPSRIVRIGHGIFVVLAFVAGVIAFLRRRTLGMALLLSTVLYSALAARRLRRQAALQPAAAAAADGGGRRRRRPAVARPRGVQAPVSATSRLGQSSNRFVRLVISSSRRTGPPAQTTRSVLPADSISEPALRIVPSAVESMNSTSARSSTTVVPGASAAISRMVDSSGVAARSSSPLAATRWPCSIGSCSMVCAMSAATTPPVSHENEPAGRPYARR